MKELYLECFSGISGDMFVAALLDLGADAEVLENVLKTVPVQGFQVKISRVKKVGLDVCDFAVELEDSLENHDHDMKYLYGEEHCSDTGHCHDEEHHHDREYRHDEEHHHDREHCHDVEQHCGVEYHHATEHHHDTETHHGGEHHHAHRGMAEVMEILQKTEMRPGARELAVRIFTILGEAEAKAHGTTLEEVHFHEVGAVDSIVDIISAAVCLDNLSVKDVIIPVLYEGSGTIRCQHGILPIPVPAVSHIVSANGLNLHLTGVQGELVTPTGAAIAAAVRTKESLPEKFQILKIGMGGGKREYENPSILRAMLIEPEESGKNTDCIYKLESNVDDCTGECLGYVAELLRQEGARDVYYTPIFMKKNRPAYQLNVICDADKIGALENIIFRETTTIGIRRLRMERSVLEREIKSVETPLGTAKVKICTVGDEKKIYPEYESVVELCRKNQKTFREVFSVIESAGNITEK